ncbi:EAL domain-containing protein [Labrenzia sp. CE80]|uniref:EAL domain-containing protein n=1 Tax=Labrenzia sp. CE80 TaxID=1788986 RepID=UPI001AD91230|nr:EAL domain-containing protein [Labrenzia sp. CE80]
MRQISQRRKIVLFFVTASLIVGLALGVYGVNRAMKDWLVTSNVDNALAQILPAIASSGQTKEFDALIQKRNTVVQSEKVVSKPDTIPDPTLGMRLSDPGINEAVSQQAATEHVTKETPNPVPSTMLNASLSGALAPSLIDSVFVAGKDDLRPGEALSEPLAAFVKSSGLPESLMRQTLAELANETRPFTHLYENWSGLLDTRSFVIVPHISNGKRDGALIIVADHEPQIAGLEMITKIIGYITATLCIASFLIAGLLLWIRFRDQVKTTRDIEFLAHHDPLTGLPNRAVFSAKLTEALRLVHAKASNMGVMLIDVDKFKEVNDTHGHGTGDIFLQVIADRLRSVFTDHLVARLSGDEFAVMIKSVSDVARLTKLASDLIAATKEPCIIDGKEMRISLSIGIARASDGSWRSSRLLHCADLALYRAKLSGRSQFCWYTAEMDSDAQKRKEIEEGLTKALRLDQFEVLFQPQYSLIDNKLKAYESLIRWEHPTKGQISPELFIPVAEESGLIEAIGDWVLFHACKEAATWEDESLRVAVNVSAAQFSPGITELKVAQALQESGLHPSRLEIEITESLLIANTDAVVDTLNHIRSMGVSIAMDDFGTGYSSLSYLSRFPFDKIKIDRSFIKNLGKDTGTDAIVTSIIGLGRSLDVTITAEGVENQEQVTLLRAAGCTLVQGYLFGRPDTVKAHEIHRARWSETSSIPAPLKRMEVSEPADAPAASQVADEPESVEPEPNLSPRKRGSATA